MNALANKPRPPRIVRPGVAKEGVSLPLADLHPAAVFPVEGSPDWSVVTRDSVWVSSARANHVVQLLAATNTVGLIADVQRPCSGLAAGFGSVWVPSCGTHSLLRLDPATGKTVAEIPADAANSEGGITVGDGSIWFVVKPSTLVRIDPATNQIATSIALPSGSENPLFDQGFVWVSSFEHDQLLKIDPKKNAIATTIPVGPKPRFLTAGAGSVWTLNQGDGTITRIDEKSGKVIATIGCGVPGPGGEITFGAGSVWAAVFDFPLTQVDAKTNTVTHQWAGQGGDGVRFGLGSVWLSNLRQANVWRIDPDRK
jgi:streptogramin lyase